MPSAAQLSIYAFGASSLLAGIVSLANPDTALQSLNLPADALPAARGNALAAIAMGIYYPLAAYQNNVSFFWATVPMRLLTTTVFWGQGWYPAALWEGIGAAVTGLSLAWGATREKTKST